jgi:hypothetical protein
MKMQIGEIADRYSILMLKSERTDLDVKSELVEYENAVNGYEKINTFIERLKSINGRIWDLESDIRKGKENELGLEEVGKRAIMIRDINGERVACKNEITIHYTEGYVETKYAHASE